MLEDTAQKNMGFQMSELYHMLAAPTLQDKPTSCGPYPPITVARGCFEVTTMTFQAPLVLSRKVGLLDISTLLTHLDKVQGLG